MSDEDLANRLTRLIRDQERGSTDVSVENLRPLSGGNARSAFAFDAAWSEAGNRREQPCVLLLQAKAGQLEQDLTPEFRVLELLADSDVPVPAPYWLDPSGRWLGRPGFAMEQVRGEGELRNLLDPQQASRNRAVGLGLADAAARLHRVDWRAAGFDAFDTPAADRVAADQVSYWESLFHSHRMEPLPPLIDAFAWLKENAPHAASVVVVHGDLRFGNLLYEGHELTALLDWEMAHLGDPCEDLAWAYHPIWSPHPQLDFTDFVAHYRSVTDVPVPDDTLLFYRLFTEIKHAVISLTGAHAFAGGESTNLRLADRMTWVAECLEQFYAWLPNDAGTSP